MNQQPTVSIVMPAYNAAAVLAEAVVSVQQQSFTDWELIIVDDASSDETVSIAHTLQQGDARIRVYRLSENGGPARARNTAIEHAQGRYIAFLDCDDCWYAEKLARQIEFMQRTECALSCTGYDIRNEASSTPHAKFVPPARASYTQLLNTCSIGCLTAMYDTQVVGKRFMPDIRKRQDYALWLDILKSGVEVLGMPDVLACYRLRSGSVSSNKLSAARYQWKIYRDIEELSLYSSLRHFAHYAVHGLLKYRH